MMKANDPKQAQLPGWVGLLFVPILLVFAFAIARFVFEFLRLILT
jgi:hypothetical protein